MKKRLLAFLILLLLAAGIAGTALHKEKKQAYIVGICQFMQHEALDSAALGFKNALTDKLGNKVVFDEQNASGDSSICNAIMSSFISEEADLILAASTNSLQVAVNSTTEIPILGTAVTDYGTALHLNDFTGTVGGNISGTSDLVAPDEQAAMIHELFPEAEKIGILYCSSETNSQYQADAVQEALDSMGYSCIPYLFVDSNDLSPVTMTAASECDVLYIPTDNTVAANAELIANICVPDGLPVITGDESTCQTCGVATLSVNYYDLGYATGEMAAQILVNNKDISTLPIQYASSFTKKYNREICGKLRIKVPEDYASLEEK